MILSRKGQCILCPDDAPPKPLINKAYCQAHYWMIKRNQAVRNYLSRPKDRALRPWYLFGIDLSTWVCENCGDPIEHFNEVARFSSQCHILPKEFFPSVAKHPLNRLHLGNFYGCDCHAQWDNNWEKASLMPVFPIAKERVQGFIHLVSPSELHRIPSYFLPQPPKHITNYFI